MSVALSLALTNCHLSCLFKLYKGATKAIKNYDM